MISYMLNTDIPPPGRFWVGLGIALGMVGLLAAFNVVINPIGAFGPPGRLGINRRTPLTASLYVSKYRRTDFYSRGDATTGGDAFLLGTSRVGFGIDTCGLPMVRQIGYGWSAREFSMLLEAILTGRRRRASIFLEWPAAADPSPVPRRSAPADQVYAALSPQITGLSLATARANMGGTATTAEIANCHAEFKPSATTPPPAILMALQREQSQAEADAEPRNMTRLRMMLATADRTCATSGLRHRIVLFRLPSTWAQGTGGMQTASANIRHAISARRGGACIIRYVDLTGGAPPDSPARARWSDPTLWTDFSHFSPVLGRTVMPSLIAALANDR